MQWKDGDTWQDAGTLTVLKGTTVTFRAVKDDENKPWSTGKPEWSGTSGASGTGETKDVTFNTLSTSTTDYKTVTAKASGESEATANIIIFDFTLKTAPRVDFPSRSTTSFGLAEVVDLSFDSNPSGVASEQIGDLQWLYEANGGIGGSIDDAGDGTGTFTAGYTPSSVTLKLRINEGPSAGRERDISRDIIKPESVYLVKAEEPAIAHAKNTLSAGVVSFYFVRPSNVSFMNLQIREGHCTGDGYGWLQFLQGKAHEPNEEWSDIIRCSARLGGLVEGYDQTGVIVIAPQYGDGKFVYDIPNLYRTPNGYVDDLGYARVDFTSDAQGTATISKGNIGPFSKRLEDDTVTPAGWTAWAVE